MAKRKRDKVEQLVGELIKNELEAQPARMVRKARRKAGREVGKLNDMLRLEYRKDEGFVDADYQEVSDEKEGKGDPPGEQGQGC